MLTLLLFLYMNEKDLSLNLSLKHVLCVKENISSGRSYYNDINQCFIDNCFFSRSIMFAGHGGVIMFENYDVNLTIQSSTFYFCSVSSDFIGGALYLSSSTSQSNLLNVCAVKCNAGSSFGHFARISTSNTLQNRVFYLSVSDCSDFDNGYHPISQYYGYQMFQYVNSSYNKAYMFTGVHIYQPNGFYCSYCTFSSCLARHSICVYFLGGSGLRNMNNANIVNNSSPQGNGVVYVTTYGEFSMEECVFSNNSNTLLFVLTGSLAVSGSYINHYSSITNGTISLNNIHYIEKGTHIHSFYQTYVCNTFDYRNPTKNSINPSVIFRSFIIILYQFSSLYD